MICPPFPSHLRQIVYVVASLPRHKQAFSPHEEGRLGGPSSPFTASGHTTRTPAPQHPADRETWQKDTAEERKAIACVRCVHEKRVLSVSAYKEDLCTTHRQPYTSAWKAQRRARAPAPGTLVCSTTHRAFARCTVLYLRPSIHTTHTCRKEKHVTIYPTLSRTTLNPSIQYQSIHSDTSNNVTSTPFNKAQTMNIQATTPFFVDNHQLHTHHS